MKVHDRFISSKNNVEIIQPQAMPGKIFDEERKLDAEGRVTRLCCIARYTVGKLQKFMQQFQT